MKAVYLFVYALLLDTSVVCAQQREIRGTLVDKSTERPIPSASVNIKSADNKIRAFKTTDRNGTFVVSIPEEWGECTLEINHLGYQKYQCRLGDKKVPLRIELEPQTVLLEHIEVKSKPKIRRTGDTVSYDVGSFAKEEDRSIGDVIRRLPGMEVSESGQIKYQGKAISNFYIDGDDLLDDRYSLGTRTIPHNMVKDIQVLNNHEHLKVLKNKRFTDQVAINLVIKESAKLKTTGEAKVAAGLPNIYDGEVNSILFNKKHKMLHVLSGNNRGKDLRGDFLGYNRDNSLARMGTMPVNNLLALGTVGAPPIPKQHYFINNSGGINSNSLVNLATGWQAKINLQGLYDRNTRDFNGYTSYLTPTEIITFDEQQQSEIESLLGAFRLSINKNESNMFLNNALSVEYEKEHGLASLHTNDQQIKAQLNHRIRGLTNLLEYVPQLRSGNIIQVDWYVHYGEKPQSLAIFPGVSADVLNRGEPYTGTTQHLRVPNFFSRISAGYRMPKGRISQYYNALLSVEDQQLSSHINIYQGASVYPPSTDSAVNNLHWRRSQFSVSASYGWKRKRIEAQLNLPITFQHTNFDDPHYHLDETQRHWLFLPSFLMKYRAWQEDELDFSYTFTNNFGNIQDVYRGLVIRDYRSLSQNSVGINERDTQTFRANYRLSRTLSLLFSDVGLQYTTTYRKAMIAHTVSNDISQTVLLPIPNKIGALQLQAGFDKYIFPIASTVKLRGMWTLTDFNQFFNGELLPFQNRNVSLQPDIELKVWKSINLSYRGNLSWSTSEQKDHPELANRIFTASQHIGLPSLPFKKVFIGVNGRHLYTQQREQPHVSYFFLDAFARYRLKKWKTDLELDLTNLTDVRTFETYAVTANHQTHNSYELRGRMAILRAVFTL